MLQKKKAHHCYFSKGCASLTNALLCLWTMSPSTNLLWRKDTRRTCIITTTQYQVKRNIKIPTGLAELRSTATFPRETNNSYHFGPNARASLLATGTQGAHRRVRLAAVALLQRAHVSADAGALGHALPWQAHLSALHFGCKDTVSRWPVNNEDEGGRGKDRRGILDEAPGTQRSHFNQLWNGLLLGFRVFQIAWSWVCSIHYPDNRNPSGNCAQHQTQFCFYSRGTGLDGRGGKQTQKLGGFLKSCGLCGKATWALGLSSLTSSWPHLLRGLDTVLTLMS